jgi:hypothetical protein
MIASRDKEAVPLPKTVRVALPQCSSSTSEEPSVEPDAILAYVAPRRRYGLGPVREPWPLPLPHSRALRRRHERHVLHMVSASPTLVYGYARLGALSTIRLIPPFVGCRKLAHLRRLAARLCLAISYPLAATMQLSIGPPARLGNQNLPS